MDMNEVALALGVIVLAGLLTGRTVKKFKIPMVIGFLLIGIILGPSVLNVITIEMTQGLEIIKVFALGVIAYVIGSELNFNSIRNLLQSIFIITIVQTVVIFIFIFASMYYIFNFSLPVSLLLSAIAPASAPAAIMAVCREYRAKGPFTTTLLGTIAFLDAVTLTLFAVVSAVVGVILRGEEITGAFLLEPLWEVGGSILLGVVVGSILVFVMRRIYQRSQALAVLISVVLVNIGIAEMWHLSPLLLNMATGITVTNLSPPRYALHAFEEIEIFLYAAFFFLAGADLRLEIMGEAWLGLIGYIVIRALGKIGGVYVGGKLAGSDENVQKYMGLPLITKAGLSVGLALMVQKSFPEVSEVVLAVVLGAVVVCELLGPFGTRFALYSANECEKSSG